MIDDFFRACLGISSVLVSSSLLVLALSFRREKPRPPKMVAVVDDGVDDGAGSLANRAAMLRSARFSPSFIGARERMVDGGKAQKLNDSIRRRSKLRNDSRDPHGDGTPDE